MNEDWKSKEICPLNIIPDAALVADESTLEVKAWNEKAEEITGIRSGKLQGLHIHKLFSISQFTPGEYEDVNLDSKHLGMIPVQLHVQRYNKDQEPCLIFTFRKHDHRFEDLLNGAIDGIIITDRNLQILHVNPAFCRIAGEPAEVFIGKNGFTVARKFVSLKALRAVIPALKKMAGGETVTTYEIEYRGKILAISARIKKGARNYVGIVRDITEKKKSETELRESEEKFRFLAEVTFEGIIVHRRGMIIDVNTSMAKMMGYRKEEAIGSYLLDFLPKSSDKAKAMVKMVQKHAKPYHMMVRRKDGSTFTAEIEGRDVKHQGKTVRIVSVRDVTSRYELQMKLKENEELYRTIFENTGAATCITEDNGLIALANTKLGELVGYKVSDLEEKFKWIDFVDREDVNALKEYLEDRKADRNEAPGEYEFRLIDSTGNRKHIRLLMDNIPGTRRLVASLIDITDQKNTEIELRERQESLKKTQTIAKIGSWAFDPATETVYGSRETNAIYGIPKGSDFDLDLLSTYHLPEYADLVVSSLREVSSNRKNIDLEYKLKHGFTGEVKTIRAIAEYSETDHMVHGVIQDITEKKYAEELARHGEQQIQSLFKAAPVGLGVIVGRRFREVNPVVCEITGYSKEELLDNSVRMLYLSEESFLTAWQLQAESFNLNHPAQIETQWKKKNGKILDILIRILAIDPHEPERGSTFIALDITDLKKVQEDLKRKNQELIIARDRAEENEKLKSAFLANMSHEIRTPMNGIIGFTNLLANPSIEDSARLQYVDIIRKSCDRLLETVNELIDVSKLESGQIKISIQDTSVNEQLESLYEFFHQECKSKGLGLKLSIPFKENQLIIRTDEQKLLSILSNLLKNAIKYTKKGWIELGYLPVSVNGKEMLRFHVKDTGIGIPADRHEAIFNRFEQADIDDRRAFEGSGLGLTIARSLTELLGGQIWLDSEKDKGSTFYFTIPFQTSKVKDTVHFDARPIKNMGELPNNLKILIAEDDVASYLHLSIMIKEHTRDLIHVSSGEEAVEMCKKHMDLDLILMDLKMPEMNGLDATREIRKFNPKVTIIAQTAYAMDGDREEALQAGCDDFITKPIKIEELLSRLNPSE